ncbi:MAG: alpha-galactosidase [Anaerolineales bacterium]|nr:alpha-galactosidase [Anaerolineales bacterium]
MILSQKEIQTQKIFAAAAVEIQLDAQPVRYYRHGWQSWSLAAWTEAKPFPIQKPTIYHPLQTDAVYAHETNPHGSWVGAVEFADGKVLLLGALATDAHLFLEENQLKGRSEAGEIEWFAAFGEESQVFEEYVAQLEIRFGKAQKNHIPRVWCSWYSFYYAISEKALYDTFERLGDLPFDVLQADDGWQKDIGDWTANKKFPSGMKALAEKIKSTGRRAGLWLAPLIATKSSRLFRERQGWFLRDENGDLVSAGFNWGQPLYALDTTHPQVVEWLIALMKQVREWGFDYYKLDFLYAGALKGKRRKDMPREAAYRECLQTLRGAMGDGAFFLACGSPIFPALGVCDALRIGPDVSHEWENHRNETLLRNFAAPSVRNAVRTVVHRLWLKDLAHIDPDVEYFESKENGLKTEHKKQLEDLALICNFKATSDLPQWMTAEERENIRAFLLAQPNIKRLSRYVYQLDERVVDFTDAVQLPKEPQGLLALWAELLGWLGNWTWVLKILKVIDDQKLQARIARIKN